MPIQLPTPHGKPLEVAPRLVVILGPTASGKSALALSVAKAAGGEILACDSTQVYRHFDIGTAKVLLAAREGIPHHLIDLVEPDEIFTAGDYRRGALEVLGDLRTRNKTPVLTAGTGLYLRALLEGLADAPQRSEALRARLERRGPLHLHAILKRLDPLAAERIAPRDTQKNIRAIEMCLLAGKPLDEIHGAGRQPLEGYVVIKIGLNPPRDELYTRINRRVEAMLAAGWLDEARALLAAGVAPDAKPFEFIGYSELRAHLEGRVALDAAVAQIQQATRNFAKRQLTWFRKESAVNWFPHFGDSPEAVASALALAAVSERHP